MKTNDGRKSPSIKDVAQRVGVSSAAVSIYLRDGSTTRVGPEIKTRIDQVIQELSYRPNASAQALSSGRTNTVAVLIPYNGPPFRSSFVAEILSGVHTRLFASGYSVLFPPAAGERSPMVLRHQLQRSGGLDGYVLFGTRYCTHQDMLENAAMLEQAGIPFVAVNTPDLGPRINQVIIREGRQANAVRFLYEQGHRKIVVMSGRDQSPDSIEAIECFREISAEYGVTPDESQILYGDYEVEVSRSAMLTRLSQGLDFTAVYCLSDTMAIGVYEAFREKSITVPDMVSVVGRNDSYFSRLMSPPLTTVHRPVFEAGSKVAETLLQSIETGRQGIKIILEGTLLVRESTRVQRVDQQ